MTSELPSKENNLPVIHSQNLFAGPEFDIRSLANTPVLLSAKDADYLKSFGTSLRLKNEKTDFVSGLLASQNVDSMASLDFGYSAGKSRPYPVVSGIALIEINGILLNREPYWSRYHTGYESIDMRVSMAMSDESVKGVALIIFSGGGVVAGCFELCERLRLLGQQKPIWAFMDTWCCSAAYAVASSCARIIVTPSGQAGSIGVVLMHMDFSKMLESWGLSVTFVFAGKHKVDGNAYEPLPKEVEAKYQKSINKTYNLFVSLVAQNRSLDQSSVKATEADVFDSEELIEKGLADEVGVYQEFVSAFSENLSTSNPGEESNMSVSEKDTAKKDTDKASENTSAADTANAKAEERKRISAITGCEHAKGREEFASYLAMETDMSAEDAIKALEKAPKATEAKAEKVDEEKAKNNSEFRKAMDNGNPDVGADGDQPDNSAEDDEVDSMFAVYDQKHGAVKAG